MSPTSWASAEQDAFLQEFYAEFVQCQAKRDYSNFWQPCYESWFAKFPERATIFPDIHGDTVLTEDQKITLAKAVETRKDLRNKLRNMWGAKKRARQAKDADGKASAALIADLIQSKEGWKQKPQKIEAYLNLYYEEKVRPMVDGAHNVGKDKAMAAAASPEGSQASKLPPTLTTIMTKAQEMFKTEPPNIIAKVEERWQEMVAEIKQKTDRKAKDKQYYIDRLVPMLAQFLGGMQGLTSWSFSILMGGPSPENGGRVEACSLHVSVTDLGSMFDQAYPEFNNGIMWPYKEFLDHVPVLTGGPQELGAVTPSPKSGAESGPPATVTPHLELELGLACPSTSVTPPMMTSSAGSKVAESTVWAPPPLTLDPSWPALAVLPPLTPDPLGITAAPDQFKYNFSPATTIDPLDDFLAKYAPEPQLPPLPASNVLCASTSASSGNTLAMFEQVVATASVAQTMAVASIIQIPAVNTAIPQVSTLAATSSPSIQLDPPTSIVNAASVQVVPLRCIEGTPAAQTMAVASTTQTPAINMAIPWTNSLEATSSLLIQLDPLTSIVDAASAQVAPLRCIKGTPVAQTMAVASTTQVPAVNTVIPQTNTSATTLAPSIQPDPPTLLPQSPVVSPQKNHPSQMDATLSTPPEAIKPGLIQTVSQGLSSGDVGSSSVQPPPIDPAPSLPTGRDGKRARQPSKRNQVANSIGTDASTPSKCLAESGAVKTGGAKKRKTK